eukprot:COSAG02_NODE_3142_length_7292_cov_31.970944_1_plen_64_part_10
MRYLCVHTTVVEYMYRAPRRPRTRAIHSSTGTIIELHTCTTRVRGVPIPPVNHFTGRTGPAKDP